MRNRRKAIRYIRTLFAAFAFLPGALPAAAQNSHVQSLLHRLQQEARTRPVRYNYSLYLQEQRSGKIVDSLRGSFYLDGKRYLDSNSLFITARNGNYYCKLDRYKKRALVCALDVVERKTQMHFSDDAYNPLALPDSLLFAQGALQADSTEPGHYKIRVRLKDQLIASMELDLSMPDYRLTAAQVAGAAQGDGPDATQRIYKIRDVRYEAPGAMFDLSRFFSLQPGKVLLKKPYAAYQLTDITR